MDNSIKDKALKYHSSPSSGKIALQVKKSCDTQETLSLAYTPGVAIPCQKIHKKQSDVYKYTSKGNLVAVVSDGTAVLGLGNIGPEASMPVMEGKGVLFKRFADVDAFPICLKDVFDKDGKTDPEKLIETVKRLEPTFGGINLEDIAAPACFEIEQRLKDELSIPVFHDDQHGTAIISLAGLLNALKLTGKKIENCKFVMNGAGAAGIACAEYYIRAGAKRRNFLICDSQGVINSGRENLSPEKNKFAEIISTNVKTLDEAFKDADIFIGVSVGNCVTSNMVKKMAKNPIVFAMSNPIPEIYPDDAVSSGATIVATGRSDFPNQINNVLGFPGIFRGALDTMSTNINFEMRLGASKALAELANEKVPKNIYSALTKAYPEDAKNGLFDGDNPLKESYIIPKPFDTRVVPRVARYVAEAAMKSGVALKQINDLDEYEMIVFHRINKLI
ncbi:MAG: malate dehydrogenase [bacterium]|nr:malate dehydrogenase [bacterium]